MLMLHKTSPMKDIFAITAFFVLTLLVAAMAPGTAFAQDEEVRTIFAIGDIGDAQKADVYPILAYIVFNDELILAETFWADYRLGGPVGLAVDEFNEYLFVSYEQLFSDEARNIPDQDVEDEDVEVEAEEGDVEAQVADAPEHPAHTPEWIDKAVAQISDTIDVFNARDGSYVRSIQLSGTSDLAGMVVHQDRGQLFVVDRGDTTVFVFNTHNPAFPLVTQWNAPAPAWWNGGWGLALIGDNLYMTGNGEIVRYYDIDSHIELGNYTQTRGAVAIASYDHESSGQVTFSTNFSGGIMVGPYLTRYEVDHNNELVVQAGNYSKGVAVNSKRDLVYVLQGSGAAKMKVFDADTLTLLHQYPLTSGWRPTDCVSSTIPFGGTVTKTCFSHPDGMIPKGANVVFKVTIENRSLFPIVDLPLRDSYDTTQLTFTSATPSADNNVNDGQIDWSDLTTSFGQNLAPGASVTVVVRFTATENCTADMTGTNLALVDGGMDSMGNQIFAAGAFDYTIECLCSQSDECDDGVFCNGVEYCDTYGVCQAPDEMPCDSDDLYCNGTESCDEVHQQCLHTGNPCPDDGAFCDGTELCDEETDQCNWTDNPCPDDGEYCNGSEGCNEFSNTCTHTGDPCVNDGVFCNGPEECVEESDSCRSAGDPCTDDGEFCNGTEQCDEAADECAHLNVPTCEDDGVYCNGEEACDEDIDACRSTGNPCRDDGSWCNGEEQCDETGAQCVSVNAPACSDDGVFCNGEEYCSDEELSCKSSGDPCPGDTTCNEDSGECEEETVDPDDEEGEGDMWPEGEITGGCCGC